MPCGQSKLFKKCEWTNLEINRHATRPKTSLNVWNSNNRGDFTPQKVRPLRPLKHFLKIGSFLQTEMTKIPLKKISIP